MTKKHDPRTTWSGAIGAVFLVAAKIFPEYGEILISVSGSALALFAYFTKDRESSESTDEETCTEGADSTQR